jgi:hypothetical protein
MVLNIDLERLAKEKVIGAITAGMETNEAVEVIVKKIAIATVLNPPQGVDSRGAVSAACRGVLSGILLLERDLPSAAAAILSQMTMVATESHLDPADCMTWAMEGMAPVCRMAPTHICHSVRSAIDERFMGAGEVFDGMIRASGGE